MNKKKISALLNQIITRPLLTLTLIMGAGCASDNTDESRDLLTLNDDCAEDAKLCREAAFTKFIEGMPNFEGTAEERNTVIQNFKQVFTNQICGDLFDYQTPLAEDPSRPESEEMENAVEKECTICRTEAEKEAEKIADVLLPTANPDDIEILNVSTEFQITVSPIISLSNIIEANGDISKLPTLKLTALLSTFNREVIKDDGSVENKCIRLEEIDMPFPSADATPLRIIKAADCDTPKFDYKDFTQPPFVK